MHVNEAALQAAIAKTVIEETTDAPLRRGLQLLPHHWGHICQACEGCGEKRK